MNTFTSTACMHCQKMSTRYIRAVSIRCVYAPPQAIAKQIMAEHASLKGLSGEL